MTLDTITSDTDVSIFVPDADPTPSEDTDPTTKDTDKDGVPDGWIDGWTYDPTKNPTHDIYNIPDGQFQFGEGEDKNLNGMVDAVETDPNDIDTDDDNLADGWDYLYPYSPYSASSIVIETDPNDNNNQYYWGELSTIHHYLGIDEDENDVYQSDPTDPTSIDSDGDGLVDGDTPIGSQHCELVKVRESPWPNQDMYTDPSMMDTDGDELSDGLEVAGWEVHIISEKTKKEVKSFQVYSNPTSTDGEDSGGDGVSDYDEFLSSSDPYSHDTDGDHILDGDEAVGELTQIEGKDPEILKFKDGNQVHLDTKYVFDEWTKIIPIGIKLVAKVKVRDNAGIEYVYIKLEGQKARTKYLEDNPLEATVSITFDFDWKRALTSGFDVNVTVADVNGNGNCTETHIDGLAEGLIKALISAWNAFVEAVKELASAMWDWIMDMIYSLVDKAMSPIYNAIKNLGNQILDQLLSYTLNLFNIEGRQDLPLTTIISNVISILIGPIVILLTLRLIFITINVALTALSFGSADALMVVFKPIFTEVLLKYMIQGILVGIGIMTGAFAASYLLSGMGVLEQQDALSMIAGISGTIIEFIAAIAGIIIGIKDSAGAFVASFLAFLILAIATTFDPLSQAITGEGVSPVILLIFNGLAWLLALGGFLWDKFATVEKIESSLCVYVGIIKKALSWAALITTSVILLSTFAECLFVLNS